MTAPKTNWVEGEYFTPAAANVVGQAIVDLQNAAPQATAVSTNAAASKATPVDGDVLPLADSAASFGLKKLSWANLKLAIGLYYNSLTATLTNKTLTNPRVSGSLLDDNGAIVLGVTPTASANSWARVSNGVGAVSVDAHSTAASTVPLSLNARGNGGVVLGNTSGVTAFSAATVTGGVNYVEASASVTGSDPFLIAAGTDANLHLDLRGKGTGVVEANGIPVVTTTGVQSLSNKTLASPTLTGSVQLNGIDVVTTSGSQGLSNKTISGASNTLANIPQSAVTSLTTDLAARQTTAQKGVANGYASLDGTGKLPTDQLPTLVSILSYRGTWNASTNSPTLANGTGTAGHTYRVDTAGTALGSTFAVGDYVIYTGSVWQKALSTDDATRNAVERTAVATLTNKTLTAPVLTSPTITGTPVADFARTRQVAGQGKFLPGTVVVPDPLGQGDGSTVVGLHNDLAHLIERGGTGTITQNGNSVDASGLSALFRGSGLNISASAVTDIFVIEVTRPATHPYGAFWQVFQTGINFRPGFVARSVKIEHRVSGVWSTSYDVTGDTEGVHYIKGGSAAPYVDAFRFTLTDFQGAGANLCRIQNIWSIGTTANPAFSAAATNFLPRSGGDLFGTTAAPPALQAAGADANIDLDLRSKGTGVVEANGVPVVTTTGTQTLTNKSLTTPKVEVIKDNNNATWASTAPGSSRVYISPNAKSGIEVVNSATSAEFVRIFAAESGGPIVNAYSAVNTNVDLNLTSQGTGLVEANGIPVVTTTGAQTVTNKTISGASNTVTNLPASATPDAARLVCATASGGVDTENTQNTWAKIASWPGISLNTDLTIVLGVAATNSGDYAIVSASQRNSGAAVAFNLQMLAQHAHPSAPQIGADSFKLVSDGQGSTTSLWVQKKSFYGTFYVYELSRANQYNYTVTYHAAAPWQSAEPVGTLSNVRSAGVTVAGVPAVTTTGTQTLTNKTLTSPRVNQLLDTNGATSLALTARPSAVNYINVFNEAAGTPPALVMAGTDTDIGLDIATKGAGVVGIYAPSGQAAGTLAARGAGVNVNLNLVAKGTGSVTVNGNHAVNKTAAVPATATSTGIIGQVAYDSTWFYVCTATNTWRRAALSTW